MDRRVLLCSVLLLPTVAVGLVGYYWFADPRAPALAAKLWVLRGASGHVTVRAFVGAIPLGEPPHPTDVELVLGDAASNVQRVPGRTSNDGTADFSLHMDTPFVHVGLEGVGAMGEVESLVTGPFTPADITTWITTSASPALRARPPYDDWELELTPPVLAVPFLSHLTVRHVGSSCFTQLLGAEMAAGGSCCDHGCRFYPTEHIVELELGHTASGKLETVLLPVVPGAMPVTVTDEQLYVYSATPKTRAHVAWLSESEVLALASLELIKAEVAAGSSGFVREGTPVYVGQQAMPSRVKALRDAVAVWVVTSSEPDFVSHATTAWPVGELAKGRALRFSAPAAPDELDGFSQHARRRTAARLEARRSLAFGLASALVGEVVLLWIYVDRVHRNRGPRLPTQGGRLWWVVIVCLALGWGGLAAFFGWK